MRAARILIALSMVANAAVPVHAEPYRVAVVRVLDKVTARTRSLVAPVGEPVQFGTLTIVARACDKRPPEETPRSAAFLEIHEGKAGEPGDRVFSGWMFSTSPSLSAMEHPIYDVWLIDCDNSADTAPAATSAGRSE
jgi:hypothetical protein